MTSPLLPPPVADFIDHCIDSVSELEALLLLFREPQRIWTVPELAGRLYVAQRDAQAILLKLARCGLAQAAGESFEWNPKADRERVALVEQTYRASLTHVARYIHAKPPTALRNFAKAFDIRGNS